MLTIISMCESNQINNAGMTSGICRVFRMSGNQSLKKMIIASEKRNKSNNQLKQNT